LLIASSAGEAAQGISQGISVHKEWIVLAVDRRSIVKGGQNW